MRWLTKILSLPLSLCLRVSLPIGLRSVNIIELLYLIFMDWHKVAEEARKRNAEN